MAHHHHQAYGYGDHYSVGASSGLQGFEEATTHHGIFELQAGMEMLGMPKPEGTSSGSGSGHDLIINPSENPWHIDHHHIQGLSLSLPNHHQQQVSLMDARYYQTYQLKHSMYLTAAQELLAEFCSLGAETSPRSRQQKSRAHDEGESSPSWTQSALFSMDILELQKLKARLLSMLEEVDRRYKRYCEQMRAVVASFEAVAGQGSATVYAALASKTISRHFRCVRDGIVGQIQATKKAMGEKEPALPGTTKGETPRLKLLDHCLRQQKVFQQGGALESPPWRPQRGLPERSVSILRAWLFEHFLHPYPSDVDKHILARQTGLSRSQVSNWFINARVRLWKPMVEEMYLEETKEQDNNQSSQDTMADNSESNDESGRHAQNPNPSPNSHVDQKPRLPLTVHGLHNDLDSLTSIINASCRLNPGVPRAENFGAVDLDFASYNQECSSSRNFNSGVSLTLGLQQHSGGGMGLSFSPTSHQQSVFYQREQMEDCQVPPQFSILDGDQGQNLPYRNLMEAQLLHDLAG